MAAINPVNECRYVVYIFFCVFFQGKQCDDDDATLKQEVSCAKLKTLCSYNEWVKKNCKKTCADCPTKPTPRKY